MVNTGIQYCDDTCNPVGGCDGCELWPQNKAVMSAVVSELCRNYPDVPKNRFTVLVSGVLQDFETANLYHYRDEYIHAIERAVLRSLPIDSRVPTVRLVYESLFKCYAAKLTDMRAGHVGYPETFDTPKQFKGRTIKMANHPSLADRPRYEKPWLNGYPRIIFISDMGDALSATISFEYLRGEIIDVVSSKSGKQHFWLWLTKRPERMAEFDRWLKTHGIDWPSNLVAMTSITNRGSLNRIKSLQKMRAKIKGLSIEPLCEAVNLDLSGIDWCVVGGESGAREKVSPFDLSWARTIRDKCKLKGVSFFLKQLGSNVLDRDQPQKYRDAHGGDWNEWPWDLRIREMPSAFKGSSII